MAGLLALLVLAWALVPWAVRHLLEQQATEALGREVRMAEVRFNPLSLVLQVDQLRIAGPAADSEPLLSLKHLHLDATLKSIWHLAPVIEAVSLEQPRLHLVRRADGGYDIDDILARLQARPAPPPDAPPATFALYNLRVVDGALTLDDRRQQQVHRLTALQLGLPFLSNLEEALEVHVEPRLAFRYDDAAFDTGAQAKPFAAERSAKVHLNLRDLDLRPFLPYLPAGLPVRPIQAHLGLDLNLNFTQPPRGGATMALSGTVQVDNAALNDASGAPLLQWRELKLGLEDVQPLRRQVNLGALSLAGVRLHLQRDAQGRLNVAPPAQQTPAAAATQPPAAASAPGAAMASDSAPASASVAAPAPGDWQLSLKRLQLDDTEVQWRDATTRPAVRWALQDIRLSAGGLAWPLPAAEQPTRWELAAALGPLAAEGGPRANAPLASARPAPSNAAHASGGTDAKGAAQAPLARDAATAPGGSATLRLSGRLDRDGGDSRLQGEDLALAWAAPYLAQVLHPQLSGRLSWDGRLSWQGLPGTDWPALKVQQLRLDQLALSAPGGKGPGGGRVQPLASLKQLAVEDLQLMPANQQVSVAKLTLTQPRLALARDREGRFDAQQWLVSSAGAAAPAAPTAPPSGAARPWQMRLQALALEAGQLDWHDEAAATEPVHLSLADLNLNATGLQWPAAPGSSRVQGRLTLKDVASRAVAEPPARTGAGAGAAPTPRPAPGGQPPDRLPSGKLPPGRLQWAGQLGLAPLAWRGTVQAERLPLQLLAPYAPADLPVAVLRAEAGWQGQVDARQVAAGWQLGLQGDARLGDLRVHLRQGDEVADDELLTWQALALQGLQLTLAPGARPRVDVAQASLTDFFARLVITEQGRLNLTGLAAAQAAAAPASATAGEAASSPAAAVANAAAPAPAASVSLLAAAPAAAVADAAAPAASASAPSPWPLDLNIGGVVLSGGHIDFTDRFIRPNYRADLTELQGRLGAFRSGSTEQATLELKGRAAGTALLDIRGSLNPTAQPLALDIQARATDLELAPLSPYAGKYAGYAIERGKLSMDVSYRIQPDGQLEARNQVVLNQLTFGERIESPDATKLPVLLAVALLKDRNGVIDLNLPIGGSINDPQFSIGGLIFKVIINLLTKAITAPFALLSGGGSEDLSLVEFLPGTARLAPGAEPVMDKVAKALTDRPSLRMTVTGASDPAGEREAMQAAQLETRLLAEQRKELLRAGQPVDTPPAALTPAERQRLLARVYSDTRLPDKPRNLIGLAKDLPPAEMEARLKAAIPVNTDTARELALQRGLAVRDALVAKGLPAERLFLAAPRLRASGEDDGRWTPRVQLSLGTQ